MKRLMIIVAAGLLTQVRVAAQVQEFDMTQQQPVYSDATGYGYDVVDAPDGKTLKPFFLYSS